MEVLKSLRVQAIAMVLAGSFCVLGISPASAAPSENAVKAAYLFNFARYVTWPSNTFDSPADPIRICVLGDNSFRRVLDSVVAGKRVSERPVIAELRESVDETKGCHILFLKSGRAKAAASLSKSSVFVVSDDEGFAVSGGMANFVRSGSKVRFEINPGAVEKAGLQVSSRLLRLAQIVE